MDDFVKDNGYCWDYVLVFKVWDEYESNINPREVQKTFSMKFVLERMKLGGISNVSSLGNFSPSNGD